MRNELKVFKALSDQNRIRIIKMLEGKELCVCDITDTLELAPSTVSKHISILRDANLIIDEKKGKWVHCRLPQNPANKFIADILSLVDNYTNDSEVVLADNKKLNKPVKGCCKI